jgi:hypothetical protein
VLSAPATVWSVLSQDQRRRVWVILLLADIESVEFEFTDSSECKDTGVTSVVKYKFLSFFATPLMLGFSVDSGDALFRSVHCTDTNGRWLNVVTSYRKDALGVDSRQAQEFCSSLRAGLHVRVNIARVPLCFSGEALSHV